MQTVIGFSDFKVSCLIGIYDHERLHEQDLLIDASWQTTEAILDYTLLAAHVKKVLQEGQFAFIEQAAQALFASLKSQFPLEKLTIKVKKPAALPEALFAFAEISL